MEIGNIMKDEIPMKNKAINQCLVFIEKCVSKRKEKRKERASSYA